MSRTTNCRARLGLTALEGRDVPSATMMPSVYVAPVHVAPPPTVIVSHPVVPPTLSAQPIKIGSPVHFVGPTKPPIRVSPPIHIVGPVKPPIELGPPLYIVGPAKPPLEMGPPAQIHWMTLPAWISGKPVAPDPSLIAKLSTLYPLPSAPVAEPPYLGQPMTVYPAATGPYVG